LLVEGSFELQGRRERTCSLRGRSLREGLHELLDVRVRSQALLARDQARAHELVLEPCPMFELFG
jgi:hypothetical protein